MALLNDHKYLISPPNYIAGQPIKAGDLVYSEDGTTIGTVMQFGLADAPEKAPRDEHWADQLLRHRRNDEERAKQRADLRRIERRQRLPRLRFWRRVRLPTRLLFLQWMSKRQWEGLYRIDDERLWK